MAGTTTVTSYGSVKTIKIEGLDSGESSDIMNCSAYQYAIFYGEKACDLHIVNDAGGVTAFPDGAAFYDGATGPNSSGFAVRLPRRIRLIDSSSGQTDSDFYVELHKFNVSSTGRG